MNSVRSYGDFGAGFSSDPSQDAKLQPMEVGQPRYQPITNAFDNCVVSAVAGTTAVHMR
jgi:hypothetical protein